MKFTNKHNLPKHIAAVLEAAWMNSSYDGPKGTRTITVTQLIGPAQKLYLERKHEADLTMDVMDTLPALRGQALHYILERAGSAAPTLITEDRLSTMHDGWTISGKSDLYETTDHSLEDWKDSSVWTFVFGKVEWIQQLNVLRWIRVRNGQTVKSLAVPLACGDWRRGEAKRSEDYPNRMNYMPIPMWTMDEAEAFVDKRLKLHRDAQEGKNVPCSPEETWQKPTVYAVMKPGRKTALSLHESMAAATDAANGAGYVQTRPGESVRCNGYCLAATVGCPQWAADPTNPANVSLLPEAAVV